MTEEIKTYEELKLALSEMQRIAMENWNFTNHLIIKCNKLKDQRDELLAMVEANKQIKD